MVILKHLELDNYKSMDVNKSINNISILGKDSILVCKNCEFRYMCNDSCTISINKNNMYFRSKECSYNPYIGKWEHEENFYSLSECGVICNENEFSIDHDKIAEINKSLWEE